MLSDPKFYLDNLYFIIKVLLENDYPLNFLFENINNRLKKIIMVENRKSVVNDSRSSAAFVVPFVRGITEKFSRLNSERMIVLHITHRSISPRSSKENTSVT